jgi:transcriptional regulator with XRE-family HTH domain
MTLDPDAVRLGSRLRKARKARGLSLGELAALTGRGKGHLSRIESGHIGLLPVPTLRKIARALKIPAGSLLDDGRSA